MPSRWAKPLDAGFGALWVGRTRNQARPGFTKGLKKKAGLNDKG